MKTTATFTVAGKNLTDYTEAGMSNFCANLSVMPTAGGIWGVRINGGDSKNCPFYPETVEGLRDFCSGTVKPMVIQLFNTWLENN